MAKPTIKEIELYVHKKEKSTKIRIVSWNDQPPVLEKRMFVTYDGETHSGRAKGFTQYEIQDIVDNWPTLRTWFNPDPKK